MASDRLVPADLTPLRATPGVIPPDGTPTLAGVRLPAGRGIDLPGIGPRAVWAGDADLDAPLATVAALQVAFPETGLWPMLSYSDEPRGYPTWPADAQGWARAGGPETIPSDGRALLHQRWRAEYLDSEHLADWDEPLLPWPDITTPAEPGTPADIDPVGGTRAWSEPGLLVLVPVARPADVFWTLGPGAFNSRPGHAELTAVLRSWEDRYGALPLRFSFDRIGLGVRRPPRTTQEARAAVIELQALSTDTLNTDDWPAAFEEMRGVRAWEIWWD